MTTDRSASAQAALRGRDASTTLMFQEAGSSGALVRDQLARNVASVASLATELVKAPPSVVMMVGRGSSDHAGVYARYLIEQRLGVVTSPTGLSLGSVYGRSYRRGDYLCLAISQSGRSPDLLASVDAIAEAGGRIVALVNDEASPLAERASVVLPLHAGPERSVAATKSFIAALAGVAQLVAEWSDDDALRAGLALLPEQLDAAWDAPWGDAAAEYAALNGLFVLGRGTGYAVAREAALKFKETCGLHAESYSIAEVLHGPATLMGPGFPALAFVQDDAARESSEGILAALAGRGVPLRRPPASIAGVHPALQPIVQVQSFYRLVNEVSLLCGRDPDRPPHLSKVTETV